MAETKLKKKSVPGANTQRLIDKLDELHETVMEISEDIERIKPHSAVKRMGGSILHGVLRGIGFVFGTTILATAVILLLQKFFQSPQFQTWLGKAFENALTKAFASIISNI